MYTVDSTHHEVQGTSHHPDNTVIVLKKWGPGECHTNRGKNEGA